MTGSGAMRGLARVPRARACPPILAALLLVGCGANTVPVEVDDESLRKELDFQRREALVLYDEYRDLVFAQSHDLLAAALPFCPGREKGVLGVGYAGPASYPDAMQEFAAHVHEVNIGTHWVGSVLPGSPAHGAGVRAGDRLVSLNGVDYDFGDYHGNNKGKHPPVNQDETTPNELVVERDGKQVNASFVSTMVCDYQILISYDEVPNAFADGESVYINTGLLSLLNDEMVGQVIAHEIAHNLMDHAEKKMGNLLLGAVIEAVVGGLTLGQTGWWSKANSKEFEAEADYVGLYVYARAGRDITTSPALWRRMSAILPQGLFSEGGGIRAAFYETHPTTPERFVAMEKIIEEIIAKQEAGEELLPNFIE